MAAASMVRRARLPNNFLALIVSIMLFACKEQKSGSMEMIKRPADDPALSVLNGIVYYKKQLFSGEVYLLYPGGDTAGISGYAAGKENGWHRKWYSNKSLSEERFYKDGRKEGIHKAWWENGKPKFEYHFENDEHEGELKEWFVDGKPSRLFHYSKGHEEGNQKMWWDDGRIRANYIVRDGERFGLLGQKLCKNEF
jgi:antitoxin component YwqK of YwqJK toxin-antitoxin module